jgi:RND family efflux transporter MFP subunit
VPGTVSLKAQVTEGTEVKRGEQMFKISSAKMLDGDPVDKAKIGYEQAENRYNRAVSLFADKLISADSFDEITAEYKKSKAGYDAFVGKYNAEGTSVNAAETGFVKQILVNEGDYVEIGQTIAVLTQSKKITIRCDVPEKYYHLLPTISGLNFKTLYNNTLYRSDEMGGKLLSYSRSTSDNSFHIPVYFEFNNTGNIIAGSYIEAYLISKPVGNVMQVPLTAIVEEQGLRYVYVQLDEDCFKKCKIETADDNGSEVHVLSGIRTGDKVVTKGAVSIKLAANATSIPAHSHSH